MSTVIDWAIQLDENNHHILEFPHHQHGLRQDLFTFIYFFYHDPITCSN